MAKILIVDDEPRIRDLIREHLQYAGFVCEEAGDGGAALAVLAQGGIDLVILDIMMPFMDGMTCLREMRTRKIMTPVIMLTARSEEYDKLAGLEGGADDYVVKPFCFERLLAKIVRLVVTDPCDEPVVLSHGQLHLDVRACRAHVGGYWVELPARECALAAMFLRHPGETLSREVLWVRVHFARRSQQMYRRSILYEGLHEDL